MTSQELIAKLQEFPQDIPVKVWRYNSTGESNCEWERIVSIGKHNENGDIFIGIILT